MTICVSVKVSEGLVLAADSAAAIQGAVQDPTGKSSVGILKTYDHVRKLTHIKDYPIGTLTWGTALIGARSVESLIKEYEYSLQSLGEEDEKIRERRMRGEAKSDERPRYSVRDIAAGLLEHVKRAYEAEFAGQPADRQPLLGVLVSGYSSGEFFPEQWLIELPVLSELKPIRPNANNKPDFGANWFGLTDAIIRLHWGRDDQAIALLAEHFKTQPDEIHRLLERLQYPVFFNGMPLQDAIDYAIYLVNVVVGRFRFVVGAPLCGGEIDVAVIAPNTFTWVQRKSWKAKSTLSSR